MASSICSAPLLQKPLPLEQCACYQRIATKVLERAVSEYAFHRTNNGAVDFTRWELLKTRENLFVYRSKSPLLHHVFSGYGTNKWAPRSRLLGVGSIVGSLEDAMLGACTPTQLAMVARSLLTQDELVEHHVLQDFVCPTVDEPFQYAGLKWTKRASRVSGMVRPRNLVYIEMSGIREMRYGGKTERIGYNLCHSVDPTGYEAPSDNNAVMARISMCSIFRQLPSGTVDVFVTISTDPGGNIPQSIATRSAASAILAMSRVVECSLDKKLARMVLSPAIKSHANPHAGEDDSCESCFRPMSAFHSASTCVICCSLVCSHCVKTRKLVIGYKAIYQPLQICTRCVENARRGSSLLAAVEEFVLDRQPTEEMPSFDLQWKLRLVKQLPQMSSQNSLAEQKRVRAYSSIQVANPAVVAGGDISIPSLRRVVSAPKEQCAAARSHIAMRRFTDFGSFTENSRTFPVSSDATNPTPIVEQLTLLQIRAEYTRKIVAEQARMFTKQCVEI